MIPFGIAGTSGVGKSSCAAEISDRLISEISAHVVIHELSELADKLLRDIGIKTRDSDGTRPHQVRSAMRAIMEAGMIAGGQSIWMSAILRDTINRYGEDVDLLIVAGIRRECEADWIRERRGIVLWLGEDAPGWATVAAPSPARCGSDIRMLQSYSGAIDLIVSTLRDQLIKTNAHDE